MAIDTTVLPGVQVKANSLGLDSLIGQGLLLSAGSFAATRTAGLFAPEDIAKAGRAAGAIAAAKDLIFGDADFRSNKTPLLGGISLDQALVALDRSARTHYARKNFFVVNVALSFKGANTGSQLRLESGCSAFNFFATEVSYNPVTIGGETRSFGAAVMDGVSSSERTDLKITTTDNVQGTLKRWFTELAGRVANAKSGTFGVPASYCLDFTIVHAVNKGYDVDPDPNAPLPFQEAFRMRPVAIEYDFSRRDAGLQEIQMSFTQVDTFMGPP